MFKEKNNNLYLLSLKSHPNELIKYGTSMQKNAKE